MDNKNIVEKIKSDYVTKKEEKTKVDELIALDKKVKRPLRIFSYTYGTIGTLVLGTGMTLAMKIIGNLMPLGIIVGILGIVMVSTAYPIYANLLAKRKAKYSEEIIAKSDEILKN